MDVALVSCLNLHKVDPDDEPLRVALGAAGLSAAVVAWDDPGVRWGDARVAVIRSTWNYVHHHEAYLAWAERCAAHTTLWNPPVVIHWNSHKSYLLELAAAGIPIVPTALVRRGTQASLPTLARDWPVVVIKPAVSAGSFGTMRCEPKTFESGQAHLDQMLATRDMLVQRYVPSVTGHGERALVWIDGQLTHALRKSPRFAGDSENISAAVPIAADEALLATRILTLAPGPLLYGRVDLVRDDDGHPMLMELELVEPCLFLSRSPEALARFVDVLVRASRVPPRPV